MVGPSAARDTRGRFIIIFALPIARSLSSLSNVGFESFHLNRESLPSQTRALGRRVLVPKNYYRKNWLVRPPGDTLEERLRPHPPSVAVGPRTGRMLACPRCGPKFGGVGLRATGERFASRDRTTGRYGTSKRSPPATAPALPRDDVCCSSSSLVRGTIAVGGDGEPEPATVRRFGHHADGRGFLLLGDQEMVQFSLLFGTPRGSSTRWVFRNPAAVATGEFRAARLPGKSARDTLLLPRFSRSATPGGGGVSRRAAHDHSKSRRPPCRYVAASVLGSREYFRQPRVCAPFRDTRRAASAFGLHFVGKAFGGALEYTRASIGYQLDRDRRHGASTGSLELWSLAIARAIAASATM